MLNWNIYLSSIVRKILTLSHVDYNNRFSSDSQLFDTILTWKSIPLIVFKENFKHILNNYCFIGCILAYYFYEVNIRFFSRLCFSNWRQMQQCLQIVSWKLKNFNKITNLLQLQFHILRATELQKQNNKTFSVSLWYATYITLK